MNKRLLSALTVFSAFSAMSANLTWIGGAEGDWNTAANWEPNQVPTQSDTVFFDSTERITVNLGATQAHGVLFVTNTPCLFFKGLESGSVMDARNDSKNIAAPVVFDENVRLNFTAGKVWRPASTLKLLGGLSGTSSSLEGSGVWTVCGPVDMAGVKCSATIDWNPSSMTDATYLSLGACDLQFNHAPATMGNLVRFENKTMSFSGVAPLTFKSSDAARPSAGINQYANPNIYLKRTMPTVFEDWLALCLANACNNNKVGFTLGSGANLWIPAEITTANSRDFSSESPTGGFKLVFKGCGANVRLTGDNSFQGQGATTDFACENGCGYNSVEFDGADDTVHPFGAAGEKLYTNTGHGVFLRSMRPGLTLANGLLYGNSVNNNNAYSFGFDGTNDLTVAGDLELGTAYSMVPVIGDMTLTLTGTLNPKDKNFDFAGTGDVVLGPTSTYTGSTGTLNKHSSGSLTLQGILSGTDYNKAYFSGGRTVLDYSASSASRLNTANSASLETPVALADALRLRGTELVLKGGAVAETVGEGNGTTFQNGLTKIRRDGGTSTIYLGALSPAPTGAQAYTAAISYQDGVAQVAASQAGKLLGGNHMVGDHFAKTDADGFVVAAADNETGDITTITGGQTTGRLVNNLFVIEPSEDGQAITLSSATAPFVANWNGMIFRGSHDFTVTGGQFGGTSTWNHSLVFNHVGTGVFTIDSELYRNGFTKIGPGTVRLTGTSTLGQSLNLYEGVFEVASATGFSPASKGNYVVYLNGGTLKTSVDVTLERPLSVGDNGGVIEVVTNTTFTQTANTVTTADNTAGPVVKRGGGVWLPSGDFQAQSELRIEEGTVRLGSVNGIGDSTVRTRSIAPTKILADGTLDVAGFNAHVGNLYLKGGKITDSATGGSLGAYTFFAESGEVNVPLTDVRCPNNNNYLVANNLEKTGPGTVTLSAANEYTGTTFVRDGTLLLTGSLAGSAFVDGGLLKGSGTVAGYAYATKDGTITATPGSTLLLGDKLAVGDGGTLRVSADSRGLGTFRLTSADGAVYLGEASTLDFDLRDGSRQALMTERVIVDLPTGAKVEGEFSNFPNGVFVDESGNKFTIAYDGGDGNDIAVTAYAKGSLIMVQ